MGFLEVNFEKKSAYDKNSMKSYPACSDYDTLIVFLKEFLEEVNFEKKNMKIYAACSELKGSTWLNSLAGIYHVHV